MDVSVRKGEFAILLSFVLLRLSGMGCCPFTVGRTFRFTQCTNTNANLVQKHPHSTPEIMFYQLSGHPFCPVKVTHTINHHVESDRVGLASYCCETWGRFSISLCLSILLHEIDINNYDYIIRLLRGIIVKI